MSSDRSQMFSLVRFTIRSLTAGLVRGVYYLVEKFFDVTFYKLLGSRTLKTKEEKADYLESDIQWIRTASEGVFDLSLIDGIADSSVEKIRRGEELSREEARLAGAVFLGDSEFLNLNRDWFEHRPVKLLLGFGDAAAHHKYQKIAKEYFDLEELSMPGYSLPEDFMIEGEKVTAHSDSFIQRAVLASTLTSIDWLEYIFDEMSVEYRQDFLDRTRNQIAEFIVRESYELDSDVAEFQRKMFRANVEWTEDLEQKFSFNSRLADKVCGEFDEIRENRLDQF